MQWMLFQRVMRKLVDIRELDPERDASAYAEQMLARCPSLLDPIGGASDANAVLVARTIAGDHLREICSLPLHVEVLQTPPTWYTPAEYLVRLVALAYLSSDHNLIADEVPFGYGFLDDCITVHTAEMITASAVRPVDFDAAWRTIRYLSLGLSEDMRPQIEQVIRRAAGFALACSLVSEQSLEQATRDLIVDPPDRFPLPHIPLAPLAPETVEQLTLSRGALVSAEGDSLLFEFEDGLRLRRHADGTLS